MKEDRLPHMLFYGPPGTGKTSTILACAKQLYAPKEFNSMVLEVGLSLCSSVHVGFYGVGWVGERKIRLSCMLFHGSPGTGKTSTILACAKQLYAPKEFNSMVLEVRLSHSHYVHIIMGFEIEWVGIRSVAPHRRFSTGHSIQSSIMLFYLGTGHNLNIGLLQVWFYR